MVRLELKIASPFFSCLFPCLNAQSTRSRPLSLWVLCVIPEWLVREQWEYPRKLKWHFQTNRTNQYRFYFVSHIKKAGQQPFCQNGKTNFVPLEVVPIIPVGLNGNGPFFYLTSDRNFRNRWLNVKHSSKQSKLTRYSDWIQVCDAT